MGSNAKVWVIYTIDANVAIIISDFKQKYVVLKAMRRFVGISKILLMKKVEIKSVHFILNKSLVESLT